MSSALRFVFAAAAALALTAACSKRPIRSTPQDAALPDAAPQDAMPPRDAAPQDAMPPQDAAPPQDAMPPQDAAPQDATPQDVMPHPRACVVATPTQPPPFPTEFRFRNDT